MGERKTLRFCREELKTRCLSSGWLGAKACDQADKTCGSKQLQLSERSEFGDVGVENASPKRLLAYSVALVGIFVAIGIGLYYVLYVYRLVPISATTAVQLAVALSAGYVAITILGREIYGLSKRVLGEKRASSLYLLYRVSAYIVLFMVLLSIAGISDTALLAGGTFAGLVIGLAGQTVLSNVIAGVMLVIARPYEVNDRVTFVTWQYGRIVPIYPPKFFSQDFLMPGYSGRVMTIGLTYTTVRLDDGPLMKIPNSVMVQAAVVSHEVKERWVRTRYEVPNSIDPKTLLPALEETIKKNEWIANPASVSALIGSGTLSTYVVSVDAVCRGSYEDPPRSSILIDIMAVVERLKEKGAQHT
jgi:small-conductance mechanosensitive channel